MNTEGDNGLVDKDLKPIDYHPYSSPEPTDDSKAPGAKVRLGGYPSPPRPSLLDRLINNYKRDPRSTSLGLVSIVVGVGTLYNSPEILGKAEHATPLLLGMLNGLALLFTADSKKK